MLAPSDVFYCLLTTVYCLLPAVFAAGVKVAYNPFPSQLNTEKSRK